MPEYAEGEILDKGMAKDLAKHDEKLSDGDYSSLQSQIETEYQLGLQFIQARWDEWAIRLQLYNNQRRDKTAVGDPLIFTIHQTILASLYDDKLQSTFLGRTAGDSVVAENLNYLAAYDYEQMEKDMMDYEWDWDTTFFGRGLCLFNEFSKIDDNTPMPEIMDPMTFIRDPRATSVAGNKKGQGALRFCGREIRMTKREMTTFKGYDLEGLSDKGSDTERIFDKNRNARAIAQGMADVSKFDNLQGENADYPVLEWMTWHKDKLVLVCLGNDRKKILRYKPLGVTRIPIIDRSLFPMSHAWDGTSIPDLTEDKQRARATVQNVALEGIKAGQYPMHAYDANKIKNKAQLERYELNKWIPVDGSPANTIEQIQRQQVKQEVNWIMGVLDTAAQKATATPDNQQGVVNGGRVSATETSIASQKVDTRYSLSAKIFGWSEKRFWRQWYFLYKTHFKADIDEKIVRITGASASTWRPLMRDNIVAVVDPDVQVESTVVAEGKRLQKLNAFGQVLSLVKDDPTANVRYGKKLIAQMAGLKTEEINALLPPTLDEMEAEKENELLNKNIPVKVTMNQDHQAHLIKHAEANGTNAAKAHVMAHKVAMMMARQNPALLPQNLQRKTTAVANEVPPTDQPQGSTAALNFDTPNTLQKIQ